MSTLPDVFLVQQNFQTAPAVDIRSCLISELDKLLENAKIRPGQSVAVAVGSRGIADLVCVVTTIVEELKQRNLKPFIVPAMGSHGGATAQGQRGVLNSLGICSEKLGIEIRDEMETECLGETSDGVPVHFSKTALSADHLIICNRIKLHTVFSGTVQSGIQKMLTIGLGKANGAAAYHRAVQDVLFEKMIRESVEVIAGRTSLLGGIALLENSRKELCKIEGILFSNLGEREAELLKQSESLMPRLPIKKIDLLIIDEIGKEISGSGLDTNVAGRKYNDHVSDERDWSQTRFIHIRGLTKATAGNATGIGIAEFCTQSVVEQIDWPKTNINAITARHPTAAMCPVVYSNDREVLDAVFGMIGENGRIVQIKNTLHLDQLLLSESCLDELKKSWPDAQISAPFPMKMTPQGNLLGVAEQC